MTACTRSSEQRALRTTRDRAAALPLVVRGRAHRRRAERLLRALHAGRLHLRRRAPDDVRSPPRRFPAVGVAFLTRGCHERACWRYQFEHGARVLAPAELARAAHRARPALRRGHAPSGRLPGDPHAGPRVQPLRALPARRVLGALRRASSSGASTRRARSSCRPVDPGLDPGIGRRSVETLLELEFDMLCLSHGGYIDFEPKARARAPARAYVTGPYWLEDPLEARADRRHDGPVDVAVVGGGVTGCACARVLAEAGLRVRVHEARQVAGGASGRNGGFALRGGAAPYDVAAESIGRERAGALLALDRAGARPDGGAGRRRVPAHRQPAARRRRGGGRAAAREYELMRRGRLRGRVARRARRARSGAVRRGDVPSRRRRAPARAMDAAARRARGGGRRRHPRGEPRRVRRRARKPSRSSSRPTATRAACSAHSRA